MTDDELLAYIEYEQLPDRVALEGYTRAFPKPQEAICEEIEITEMANQAP